MRKDPSEYVRVQIVLYPNKDKDLISIMLYLRDIGADMGPLYRHILRKFVSGDITPVAIPGFAATNSINKNDKFYIEVRLTPEKDKAVLDFIHSLGSRTHNFVIKNIARIYFGPNVIWPNREDFDEGAANAFTKKIQRYNIENKVDPGRIQVITPNARLVTTTAPPVVEVIPVYSAMLADTDDINFNKPSTNTTESEFKAPVQTKEPNPPSEKTKTSFIPDFGDDDDENNTSAFEEEEVRPGIQFDEEDEDNPGFEEVSGTSSSDDNDDDNGDEDTGFDFMSMINSFEG